MDPTGQLRGVRTPGPPSPASYTAGGTYMTGTVNSIPFLKVGRKSVYFPSHLHPKMHQIAQICTYIFKIFPASGHSKPGSSLPRLLHLDERLPSHFFRDSAAAGSFFVNLGSFLCKCFYWLLGLVHYSTHFGIELNKSLIHQLASK